LRARTFTRRDVNHWAVRYFKWHFVLYMLFRSLPSVILWHIILAKLMQGVEQMKALAEEDLFDELDIPEKIEDDESNDI
jgi:hypothetical protein